MPVAANTDDGALATDRPLAPLAWAGVALAVLAGLVARLVGDSPLWLDEALSVNIADLPVGEIETALRSDGHPPLYYWLLHAWTAVAGDGDAAARSLSVVFGVAALPLAWVVGRRAGGRPAAAWSVVLVALAPYAVRYSSEARMYALVMALTLAGAAVLPSALRSPAPRRLVAVAALTASLVLTQYWALYLVAAVGGVLLWRWRARPSERAATVRVVAAMAVGGAAFGAWLPAFVDQARHTGTPWALPARPAQIVMDTVRDLGTGGVDVFAEGELLGVLLAVLVTVAVLGDRRSPATGTTLTPSPEPGVRGLAVVTFATLGLGAVVGRLSGATFNARYAAVVVPLLLVLAAVGLTKLPRRWPLIGAAVALVGLAGAGIVKVVTTDRTEAADLAGEIAGGDAAGDVVVACPDQLGVSLHRALRQAGSPLPVLPYPAIDGDPRFVPWRDYEDRNDAADPGAIAGEVSDRAEGAVWLVWDGSYRTFEGDCETLIDTLATLRGAPAVVGQAPRERAFEHGDLLRFEPVGSGG